MSSDRNSFLDRIKVDDKTQAELAQVIKNYNNSNKNNYRDNRSMKNSLEDSGRERGDDGPGGKGRESGLKCGHEGATVSGISSSSSSGHSGTSGGSGSGHAGTSGGHGSGGGGHSGSGGGHGR